MHEVISDSSYPGFRLWVYHESLNIDGTWRELSTRLTILNKSTLWYNCKKSVDEVTVITVDRGGWRGKRYSGSRVRVRVKDRKKPVIQDHTYTDTNCI
jgi:hypothetical protein